jgi:hypothetical protein
MAFFCAVTQHAAAAAAAAADPTVVAVAQAKPAGKPALVSGSSMQAFLPP